MKSHFFENIIKAHVMQETYSLELYTLCEELNRIPFESFRGWCLYHSIKVIADSQIEQKYYQSAQAWAKFYRGWCLEHEAVTLPRVNFQNIGSDEAQKVYNREKVAIAQSMAVAAIDLYWEAASTGCSFAQLHLGKYYYDNQSFSMAFQLFGLAAHQGISAAQLNVGTFFERGIGVPQNLEMAMAWYAQATVQRNDTAKKRLLMLARDMQVTDPFVLHVLAELCETGNGVKKNPNEAFRLYNLAAAQGYLPSQYKLAKVSSTRATNAEEDIAIIIRLTNQDGAAQYSWAKCFATGRGVKKDLTEAIKWYTAAARQGHIEAQLLLAWCYENGIGVQPNLNQAIYWYGHAAFQGDNIAQLRLRDILQSRYIFPNVRAISLAAPSTQPTHTAISSEAASSSTTESSPIPDRELQLGMDEREVRKMALHIACIKGDTEAVTQLLNAGVHKNIASIDGITPLLIACYQGNTEVVRILLQRKANIEKTDNNGNTPLLIACSNNHPDIVEILLKAGANKNKSNKYGETPFTISRYQPILELLFTTEIKTDSDTHSSSPSTPSTSSSSDASTPLGNDSSDALASCRLFTQNKGIVVSPTLEQAPQSPTQTPAPRVI